MQSSHWKRYSVSISIGGKEVVVIHDLLAACELDAKLEARKYIVVEVKEEKGSE